MEKSCERSISAVHKDYSMLYSSHISWSSPTTALPIDNDPRSVFERLFGLSGSTDPAARLARIRRDRSILDLLTEHTARLSAQLGPSDRACRLRALGHGRHAIFIRTTTSHEAQSGEGNQKPQQHRSTYGAISHR